MRFFIEIIPLYLDHSNDAEYSAHENVVEMHRRARLFPQNNLHRDLFIGYRFRALEIRYLWKEKKKVIFWFKIQEKSKEVAQYSQVGRADKASRRRRYWEYQSLFDVGSTALSARQFYARGDQSSLRTRKWAYQGGCNLWSLYNLWSMEP